MKTKRVEIPVRDLALAVQEDLHLEGILSLEAIKNEINTVIKKMTATRKGRKKLVTLSPIVDQKIVATYVERVRSRSMVTA